MFLFKTIDRFQDFLDDIRAKGDTIGFVPTMGALHEGHAQLIRHSIEEGHFTVVSIFVNPTQFNNQTDLNQYPRTTAQDLEFLYQLGCHAVFLPDEKEIYPDEGYDKVKVELGKLGTTLEGAFRPGHFEGVVQVMERLLRITEPDYLIMGEKDLQQLAVIRTLIRHLSMEIELVGRPVVREESGLALSSRNKRLSEEEKQKATAIFRALLRLRKDLDLLPKSVLLTRATEEMESEGLKVEYVEVVDGDSLEIVDEVEMDSGRVYAVVAAWCDQVRLIDSMKMN